jgi:hypothetical protein
MKTEDVVHFAKEVQDLLDAIGASNINNAITKIIAERQQHQEKVEQLTSLINAVGVDNWINAVRKVESLQKTNPVGRFIYVVQNEDDLKNNTLKVGFTQNVEKRWGKNWGTFENKKVYETPFYGDCEVHRLLRRKFERNLTSKSVEMYFAEFEEVCQCLEEFFEVWL